LEFHPQTVHFPLALLWTAGGLLLYGLWKPSGQWRPTIMLMQALGTAGLALAIISGLQAEARVIRTETVAVLLDRHELLGYLSLWVFGLLLIWYYLRAQRFQRREQWLYSLLFLLAALLMTYGAYAGGQMVYEEGVGVDPMRPILEQQMEP
jgi:uncharacterized membrane protein